MIIIIRKKNIKLFLDIRIRNYFRFVVSFMEEKNYRITLSIVELMVNLEIKRIQMI